jgi:hypothetical protein
VFGDRCSVVGYGQRPDGKMTGGKMMKRGLEDEKRMGWGSGSWLFCPQSFCRWFGWSRSGSRSHFPRLPPGAPPLVVAPPLWRTRARLRSQRAARGCSPRRKFLGPGHLWLTVELAHLRTVVAPPLWRTRARLRSQRPARGCSPRRKFLGPGHLWLTVELARLLTVVAPPLVARGARVRG